MGSDRCEGGQTLRLAFGLVVLLLGLMLTLDNFGLFEAGRLLRFWPVLLIGLGLAKLFDAFRSGTRRGAGYLVTLLGVTLLLLNLGVLRFRAALAVFLVAVGLVIVWHAARRPDASLAAVQDPNRQFDMFALLAGIQRVLSARDFRGGNATAVLGGCDIDLRQASIDGGEAVINTFAFWGGIEIKVPDDWTVETQGTALLGGFDDTTRRPDVPSKKLIVTGLAVMGGVSIRN